MKSKLYWKIRSIQAEMRAQSGAKRTVSEVLDAYENALREINADIRQTFSSFTMQSGIEYTRQAQQLLTRAESEASYRELLRLIHESSDVDIKAQIALRINAQAYGARISRLEGLKNNIFVQMMKAAITEEEKNRVLHAQTYAHRYYSTINDIAKGMNAAVDFNILPQRAINTALEAPWKGSNYATRIWKKNADFTQRIQTTVETGLIRGSSVPEMSNQIQDLVKKDENSAARLIRTETSHFMNQGQMEAYEDIGIEMYQFVASLGERTCGHCGHLDGKIFPIEEASEGDNYPPIHPNCRCITVPVDMIPKTRIARDPWSGENYKVDGSMTYDEWIDSLSDEQFDVIS